MNNKFAEYHLVIHWNADYLLHLAFLLGPNHPRQCMHPPVLKGGLRLLRRFEAVTDRLLLTQIQMHSAAQANPAWL